MVNKQLTVGQLHKNGNYRHREYFLHVASDHSHLPIQALMPITGKSTYFEVVFNRDVKPMIVNQNMTVYSEPLRYPEALFCYYDYHAAPSALKRFEVDEKESAKLIYWKNELGRVMESVLLHTITVNVGDFNDDQPIINLGQHGFLALIIE